MVMPMGPRGMKIDPEREYRFTNGFVYTGEQMIQAIKDSNHEHRTNCAEISPQPETPGFICTLPRDHPGSHNAQGHMKWWADGGYEWERSTEQARWISKRRDQAKREAARQTEAAAYSRALRERRLETDQAKRRALLEGISSRSTGEDVAEVLRAIDSAHDED